MSSSGSRIAVPPHELETLVQKSRVDLTSHSAYGFGMDGLVIVEHERYYGFGMDALVIVCSRNTKVMVLAWMLWSSYALGTRMLLWFWHGCSGHRML